MIWWRHCAKLLAIALADDYSGRELKISSLEEITDCDYRDIGHVSSPWFRRATGMMSHLYSLIGTRASKHEPLAP